MLVHVPGANMSNSVLKQRMSVREFVGSPGLSHPSQLPAVVGCVNSMCLHVSLKFVRYWNVVNKKTINLKIIMDGWEP